MSITEILEKAFLDGYASEDLTIITEFTCILLTAVISMYIYFVYRRVSKKQIYNRNFNMSLVALSVITAAVILTIQSNIVVSLGMVGALSIVRFRTAVKDPLDLVFLFWSLSTGIICGAGYIMIAVIAAIILTIIVVIFSIMPSAKDTVVLIINASSYEDEDAILDEVYQNCNYSKVRGRNISRDGLNLAIEVQVFRTGHTLIDHLMAFNSVTSVSLVEHDGEIAA